MRSFVSICRESAIESDSANLTAKTLKNSRRKMKSYVTQSFVNMLFQNGGYNLIVIYLLKLVIYHYSKPPKNIIYVSAKIASLTCLKRTPLSKILFIKLYITFEFWKNKVVLQKMRVSICFF